MKILITGGCSARALKLLKAFPNDTLILADYGDVPQTGGNNPILSLGERNEEITAHHLLNTCLDHSIELLLPLYAFEAEAVAKALTLFEEFGIAVLLPAVGRLQQFLGAKTTATNDFIVLNKGTKVYPNEDFENHEGLSGVFNVDSNGYPVQLFTIPE